MAAITDQIYFAVQRAARSSYVKEAADFATALLDPNGTGFAYPPSAGVTMATPRHKGVMHVGYRSPCTPACRQPCLSAT
jgi:N-methylhydantoinase B/oxoprolinase/acetone carboxylase alpha subunit